LNVSYPAGTYAHLYGAALSAYRRSATTVTLTYSRLGEDPLYVDGVERGPAADTVTLPVDGSQNWDIYLPASSKGSTYAITVKSSRQTSTKTMTLTAGEKTEF
jgi:hypothetical protein